MAGKVHIYTVVWELKALLSQHKEDPAEMKTSFNKFMLDRFDAAPESEEYTNLVDLFRDKGGLKGYLDFMEV